MGKIYMIGSQKGGTVKTTTTFNLAYCLQKMGKKVLAVLYRKNSYSEAFDIAMIS